MEIDGPTSFVVLMTLLALAAVGALACIGGLAACFSKRFRHYGMLAIAAGSVGAVLGLVFIYALNSWVGGTNIRASAVQQWSVVLGLAGFGFGASAGLIMFVLRKAWPGHLGKRPA